MKINNKGGFVVPVAIAVLVVASLGLLTFSWWGSPKKENSVTTNNKEESSTVKTNVAAGANDDQTLNNDGTSIEASLKGLDNSDADINSGINDAPASLQ